MPSWIFCNHCEHCIKGPTTISSEEILLSLLTDRNMVTCPVCRGVGMNYVREDFISELAERIDKTRRLRNGNELLLET